jgi:hypothetical protein
MNHYAFHPTAAWHGIERKLIAPTIAHLRRCQAARAKGQQVSYTTDPAWLVNMAINRRAHWPDDPSCTRGSARPTRDGRYPTRAIDSTLQLRAREINTPRLRIYISTLGHWRKLIMSRIPERITTETE